MSLQGKLCRWADELRAMSQIGLQYATSDYDRERYERIQRMAMEMFSISEDKSLEEVRQSLKYDLGYITPKVGVDGAVFNGKGEILLIQRSDNRLWALPGGWAEVGETPSSAIAREFREETGLEIQTTDLLGIYDGRIHQPEHPHQIYHIVFACHPVRGKPRKGKETLDIGFFPVDDLPEISPPHGRPIQDAFAFRAGQLAHAIFDQEQDR